MNRPIMAGAVAAALLCLFQGMSVQAQAPDLEHMDLVLKSVPDGPVAIVRGEPIPNNQFRDLYVGEVVRLHRSNPDIEVSDVERIQVAMASLRILIEREVLYQEALKRNFAVSDADFQKAWQEEMDRMRQPLTQEGQAGPTDEEILEMAGTSREDAGAELRKALLMEKMRDAI
ncbi:MAG: SurA N-terminal domain-containing protein, partial [Candidatus Hydrogenedentes bacterium]|nr:SurA N-terminal domain-containing protein [Candidatus Hydrogenedentota bacterium]